MNETQPRVSILIPCYNAEKWVRQAIESAIAQTCCDKEIIVVDDGSTDQSFDVIRSFGDAIRFETGPNRGGNAARNRLLELSRGEWLQYLDADDYLLPEKIERQLAELAHPDAIDVAYSSVIMDYWENDRSICRESLPIPAPHDPWEELIRWVLPQTGAALWRRSTLVEVGGWKPDQPCCQEHELYLRLLTAGKKFQFCPTPGAVYRIWSTNTVCRRNPQQTINRRLEIVDAAECWLQEMGILADFRLDAIALTRLECARSLYPLDRDAARQLAWKARQAHPAHRLYPLPCFPKVYRWMYRALGFQITEIAAQATRRIRNFRSA